MPVSRLNSRLLPELGLPTRRTSARSAARAVIAVRRAEQHMGRDVHLEREGSSRHRVDAGTSERSAADAAHDVAVHEPELPQPPAHFRAEVRPEAVDARTGSGRKLREVPHGPFILRLIRKVEDRTPRFVPRFSTLQSTGITALFKEPDSFDARANSAPFDALIAAGRTPARAGPPRRCQTPSIRHLRTGYSSRGNVDPQVDRWAKPPADAFPEDDVDVLSRLQKEPIGIAHPRTSEL